MLVRHFTVYLYMCLLVSNPGTEHVNKAFCILLLLFKLS